ncbi:succinate dehydrogenase assembly factor 2, mitochondrial isoform X2 [Strongylocentrotus purpuratus]|uniref:Succinate dehydrogenase assembly factor 2, mitochondrial n=1 Tax=Strongylocentrotus purpuratus TaxID=7668 RepID=A0A7M7TH86_STRPU|nr:succinate dehydrogenase assembly factor 2, mitochondrial isoform X2 [Strongylocentrotus purpuratus]|eukprot:XP_793951.1 PREDICTED: succinate dehydrogenase assembly factor 2, mitochondrial isoform X2 [Strongylocentrotus purpuratus]
MASYVSRLLGPSLRVFAKFEKNSGVLRGSACLLSHQPPQGEPPIPEWKQPQNESMELKRARLVYQSRKRGMLENGIILSTFAGRYLEGFDEEQLDQYDNLINKPDNDWDLFYWVVQHKPTPEEYDHGVMDLLKTFAKNPDMESRIRQPDLAETEQRHM